MKQYQLQELAQYLSHFRKIHVIERVDDMVLKVVFDRHEPLFLTCVVGTPMCLCAKSLSAPKSMAPLLMYC